MKKNYPFFFAFYFALFFSITSYAQRGLYVPNMPHYALLNEKKESAFSFGVSGQAANTNRNFQYAYALGNRTLVAVSYASIRSSFLVPYNRFFEGSIGKYVSFKESKSNGWNTNRAELLLSYGYGASSTRSHDGHYYRTSLQASIGQKRSDLDFSFSSRINFVNLYYHQIEVLPRVSEVSMGFVTVEPTMTFGIGGRNLKFYIQTGLNKKIMGDDGYKDVKWDDEGIFLNAGVRYRIIKEDEAWKRYGLVRPAEIPENIWETKDEVIELPSYIFLDSSDYILCFKLEDRSADPQSYRVVYNAKFLDEHFIIDGLADCMEMSLRRKKEAKLRLLLNRRRKSKVATILIGVISGDEEQWFRYTPEKGKNKEIVFGRK